MLKSICLFAMVLALAAWAQNTPWTQKQVDAFCSEQRKTNGHSQCLLPDGVVVGATFEQQLEALRAEIADLKRQIAELRAKLPK